MQIASYAKKEMSSKTKKILGIVAGALAIVLLIGGLVAAYLIFGAKYYCTENRRCFVCQKKIIITIIITEIIITTITTTIIIETIITTTIDSYIFGILKNYFTLLLECKIVFIIFLLLRIYLL